MTLVFLFTFAIGNVWADITWTAPQSSGEVDYQQTMSDGSSKFHNKNSATSTSKITPEEKTNKWSIKTNNSGGFWIIPNEAITKVTINYLCGSTNSGNIAYKVQTSNYGNNTSSASTATFAVKTTADKNKWFDAELTINVEKDQFLYVKFPTNVYISHITLTTSGGGCTANPATPTKFEAGSITEDGVTFTITDDANDGKYDIYYSTNSTAPEATTAASATSTAKSKAITGLTASTKYYAWVRSVCDDSHKSAWVALEGGSFTTLSGPRDLFKINMTATSETKMPHGQKVELTSTYGTITGGYADLYNKHASDDSKLKVNSDGITFTGGDPCVILYLNEPLHVGDKIEFTSSSSNQIKIGVVDNKDQTLVTTSNKSYTVASEGLAGKQVIYLWRVSNTTYIKTLTISTTAEQPTFRTVTFDPNYTSATNITRTVADGAKVVYVPKDPENGTQEFEGWFEGSASSAFDFSTVITADKTLTAHWSAPVVKHTISFNSDGGTAVEPIEVEDGQVATVPTAPKKVGYEFDKWYNGEAVYDWSAAVTDDLTLTAHWNKIYVPQGANYVFENTATLGTAPNAITVTKDNKPNAIAANSRIDNMWLSAMSVKLEDGTYSGSGDDFKGWKINTSTATIRFFVENDSRVTVTVGTLSSGMNIAYTGTDDAAHDEALSAKNANVYNVKGGSLITLTTQGSSTVTLKGIAVTEIPAQSDDATLSDLKVGGVTVDGFSASKLDYSVELPYGSTSQPEVTATPNDEHVTSVVIAQNLASLDDATITVTAEDGVHYNVYTVHFTVAPKLGVELIKATHTGTTTASKEGYWTADVTVDKKTQSKKLGGNDDYFGLTLAGGKTFKNNDIVVIYLDPTQTPSAWLQLFNDKGTNMIADVESGVKKGANYITLTGLPEEGIDKLYLYRTGTAAGNMNPYVDYIAVYRLMAPFIEEFKIGEAVGTIDQGNKTIAVEVPYATDVTSLTPDIVAYANGGATLDKTGAQDFTSPVTYKVSSAYAEDGDVTYTVTVTVADHYEAMIVGGASYATLAEAVAAAQDGDVVKLLDNVDLMATGLTIAKNMTLDLNGFNIKAGERETNDIFVPAGVKLTLVDNSIEKDGKIYTEEAYIGSATGYGLVRVSGELLMQSGNIYAVIDSDPANLGQFAVALGSGGKVTIEGGQIKAGWYAIANNGNNTGSTIIVSGGELISTADFAIYSASKESTVSVEGGVVYGATGGIAMNRGDLNVTGGTITSKGQGSTGSWGDGTGGLENAAISANGEYESVSVEISGGTVIAEGNAIMITNGTVNPVEVAISGGQFSEVVPEEYCAKDFIPVTTPNDQGKYEVIAAGIIRAAAADAGIVWTCNLDNGVVIYSSESDGRLKDATMTSTSSDVTACGGADGYNVNQSKILLQFPVNVKEFTLYGANSTERTISTIHVSETASADYKIKIEANLITGTYTNTKDGKCQTLTAAFNDANIIPANYYVLVTFSGTANIYRVLYTEAACTTPTVTVADQTAKDGVEVTLTAEASALGATYQWYTCDDELGTHPVIMTGKTAKTLSVIKSGADDQFYKVVVGCNCSAGTAEAVAKVSLYTAVTTLVYVTENTVWDWTAITNDVDGNAIGSNGPTLNEANYILANYIQGDNWDKVEGNNGAYAIRSNSNQYYQGASLHMHTTKAGYLKINARNDGNTMNLKVANIDLGKMTSSFKDYVVYVPAGDVVIENVPVNAGKPMRVAKITFTVDETPDYTRNVSNNIGTLCVDHNVVAGGALGATFYQIASRNELYDYKIDFEEVLPNEELKAGEPYIFKSNTGKIELFYGATVADAPVAVRGMHGWFSNTDEFTMLDITEENKSDILYIAQNKLWNCEDLVDGDLKVVNNRAYIVMSEVPTYADYVASQNSNNAPRRRVTLSKDEAQVATGFGELETSETPVKVLINGQIFIIRGEKMFDATGRLVK